MSKTMRATAFPVAVAVGPAEPEAVAAHCRPPRRWPWTTGHRLRGSPRRWHRRPSARRPAPIHPAAWRPGHGRRGRCRAARGSGGPTAGRPRRAGSADESEDSAPRTFPRSPETPPLPAKARRPTREHRGRNPAPRAQTHPESPDPRTAHRERARRPPIRSDRSPARHRVRPSRGSARWGWGRSGSDRQEWGRPISARWGWGRSGSDRQEWGRPISARWGWGRSGSDRQEWARPIPARSGSARWGSARSRSARWGSARWGPAR
ncbi:hypothetical protein SAMN05421776_102807 [Nocardia farcinica]|uniref:Uncharacterized protein n=1 Tax=Nocardia farcinica TaxID=37329 RepID=A0A0H5NVJ4_NOCFR|nr:Uncharacterised protein [Nocardia farcinica]SIS99951.1 hypothetical protein SAMN05421776_102807 [Nocardia farcinica]